MINDDPWELFSVAISISASSLHEFNFISHKHAHILLIYQGKIFTLLIFLGKKNSKIYLWKALSVRAYRKKNLFFKWERARGTEEINKCTHINTEEEWEIKYEKRYIRMSEREKETIRILESRFGMNISWNLILPLFDAIIEFYNFSNSWIS